MRRIAIVDYGMGNLDSVRRAVEECGGDPVVTSDEAEIRRAPAILLPGVGAFAHGMRNIRERRLEEALREQVLGRGVPFLGICLGMQLLASRGDESGATSGLGWIDGEVRRMQPSDGERIPHVGWNEVRPTPSPLFEGIEPATDFYFVHSFELVPAEQRDVIATTPYCGGFVSAVAHDNVFGVQFHPEKSQRSGFQLLENFLQI